MRSRSALLAVSAALLLAVPSAASAAPACPLVKDNADDASVNPALGSVLKYQALDIKSYDVSTGKKTLVAVLRLASAKHADAPQTSLNPSWSVTFKIGDTGHAFSRRISGSTVTDTATAGGAPVSGVTVAVGADSITWTVPRAKLPKLKKGAVLTEFYASSNGGGGFDQAPDGGFASNAKFVDGTRGCVKAA